MKLLIPSVLLLRFFLPLLFFKLPFQASWLNFILDTIDGDILIPAGLDPKLYQVIDKMAGLFTYIMMILAGYRWKIGKTLLGLFLFRIVGQMLFFLTGNDLFLFLFPNFLEPLFMIYALLLFLDKKKAHSRYVKYFLPIWSVIIVYKMWNEWNIHIIRRDLSDLFLSWDTIRSLLRVTQIKMG